MFRTNSLRSFLFAFFFVLSCLSSLSAQQRFSAGPRVGLNLSNYWGNNDNMKYTPGLAAGAFLMYSSLNHFGISADVLFSQRGTSFNDETSQRKFIQRVNYLEIPVVARYFLTLSGNFRPNIFLGPSLGIKLNAKRIKNQVGTTVLPDTENNNNFDSIDFGGTGGFQLNWGVGNRQRFLIDARYTLGLSPVQTNIPNDWSRRNSLQNSTITVTLGYGFGVGKEYPSRFRR